MLEVMTRTLLSKKWTMSRTDSLWVGHIHHRHNREFFHRPKITAPRLGLQLLCPICPGWLLRQLKRWLRSKIIVNAKEGRTRKFRCQSDQYSLCSKILRKNPFVEHPL